MNWTEEVVMEIVAVLSKLEPQVYNEREKKKKKKKKALRWPIIYL